MNKFLVILKREYAQVVRKKSFIVGIVLTPLIMMAFTVLPALMVGVQSSKTEMIGIIDRSGQGIGHQFSAALEQYKLPDTDLPYYGAKDILDLDRSDSAGFDEALSRMREAVAERDLKYFLVINPDPHQGDTNIYLVTNSDAFRSIRRFEHELSAILSAMRLQSIEVEVPIDSILTLTRTIDLPIRDVKGESLSSEIKYMTMMAFVGIMLFVILWYGQLVMRSVIEEKNSRIMEVLISSVSPFQLMLGKILGLGAATLTQISIWVILGAGLFAMRATFAIDPGIERIFFDPFIVVTFIVLLTLGYLLFSTVFALVGSIVNSDKEAQNFVTPISLTLTLPFLLGLYVIQNPNSAFSITMSFIPFLTPTMMMMRVVFIAPTMTEFSLFSGIVGQALLSFVTLSATIVLSIWLTGRVFRVGILMYGKRPTLPEIIKWIKYK